MLDRRALLLASASALASCASAPLAPDAAADAQLHDLVERLAERSRPTRAFLLRRFDATRLTPEGRILYAGVIDGAEADAALARRRWGASGLPYAVSHRYGAYRRAAELRPEDSIRVSVHEVNQDTNQLAGDAARGVIPPDFLIDATIPALETAAQRVRGAGGEDAAFLADALTNQAEALRTLRTRAGLEPGVWRLPEGEDFYAQTLQFQLGARTDAREAHARALERCREMHAEADALLRGEGLTSGDVGERLRALATDPRYLYSDDDAGRDRAVADMNASLERIRALIGAAIPGAEAAPARVARLAVEMNGAQGRRVGSRYEVDLGNIRQRPAWTLPSVVHHELVPGHILQAQHERQANAPALQVRYASGYSEGWATYAEQLAAELGAFDGDPRARLGCLQWMLFRLARVAADTGIHVMRWSRARAEAQMHALQGGSIAFVSIADDVVRICAQPGLAAAQGLAAMQLAELRDATRRSARGAYNDGAFHLAMLRHGPLAPAGLAQAARAAFDLR